MRLRFGILALLLCLLAPAPSPRRPRRPARSRNSPAQADACPRRPRSAARRRAAWTTPARSRWPRRAHAVRRLGDAGERHGVQRGCAQWPAGAAQPLGRMPRLGGAGRLRRGARTRGRLGDRRLTGQPARLRGGAGGGRRRELRSSAERIARAARGPRRLRRHPARPAATGCDSAQALAAPTHRDLSGRPLRLRGRFTADSLLVFCARRCDRATDAAHRHRGLPPANRGTCAPVTGLDGPSAIAITPDGNSLYVASGAGTLTSFHRDVDNRSADAAARRHGCLSDGPLANCTAIGGLARASALAITPDGRTVIAAGTDDDAVLSFRRDLDTGALTRVSCVSGSAATAAARPRP